MADVVVSVVSALFSEELLQAVMKMTEAIGIRVDFSIRNFLGRKGTDI